MTVGGKAQRTNQRGTEILLQASVGINFGQFLRVADTHKGQAKLGPRNRFGRYQLISARRCNGCSASCAESDTGIICVEAFAEAQCYRGHVELFRRVEIERRAWRSLACTRSVRICAGQQIRVVKCDLVSAHANAVAE